MDSRNTTWYEKRARVWDRWVTVAIVALLFLPFPFARFESWPQETTISERLIMPWSRFQICYVAPDREPVEESYEFTWKGDLIPSHGPPPSVFFISSIFPPVLKWENAPEISLGEPFHKGDFLRIKTFWRPLILWPFEMAWRICSGLSKEPGHTIK